MPQLTGGNMDIDTGDTVKHKPTGEEWLVAGVKGDRLMWCGWPEGWAALADCELVEKATRAARDKLLHELAAMQGHDMRKSYAMQRLGHNAALTGPQRPEQEQAT